jgi:hypothetical protein
MYIRRVKKKKYPAPRATTRPVALKDQLAEAAPAPAAMVRTQIYLSKAEHEFVRSEAKRRDEPMASVIRAWIDEKMETPEQVWQHHPLLTPPADDPSFVGHEDGALNHDHYLYGAPKSYERMDGRWVWKPLDKK